MILTSSLATSASLHDPHQLLGHLRLAPHGDALLDLLGGYKLHIAVLVVMDLDFEDSCDLGLSSRDDDAPLRPPAAVPVILWLELMILNAADNGLSLIRLLGHGGADPVSVVLEAVLGHLGLDG